MKVVLGNKGVTTVAAAPLAFALPAIIRPPTFHD
jgi:hypothetical protein